MRRRGWLAAILLLGGLVPAAAAQVKLEWKLEAGQKFFLEERTTARQTLKALGDDLKESLDQTRVTRFTVLKKNADGGYLLEQKIVSVRINGAGGQLKAKAKLLTDMEGATFKVTLGPRMQVTKIEGYDALIKKMQKNEQIGKMLQALMPEESLTRATEALFHFLPDKEVAKGGEWSEEQVRPLGLLGTLKLETGYTYEGTEKVGGKDAAVIKAAVLKSSFSPRGATGGLPFQVTKGDIQADRDKCKTTLYFDATAGRLVKSERTLVLTGTLTVSVMGNTIAMDLQHDETVSSKLLDKNPVD